MNETVSKVASACTYSLSLGLQFLNENAQAIGIILATMTFFINWTYQHKNHVVIKRNGERRRDYLSKD